MEAKKDEDLRRLTHWSDYGGFGEGFRPGSRRLRLGPSLRGLVGADAEAAFEWGQGAAWRNFENGQSGASLFACSGRGVGSAQR